MEIVQVVKNDHMTMNFPHQIKAKIEILKSTPTLVLKGINPKAGKSEQLEDIAKENQHMKVLEMDLMKSQKGVNLPVVIILCKGKESTQSHCK